MTKKDYKRVIAVNRKAKHEYFILATFEAGLVLTGTEVKSLRHNEVSLNEAYADAENDEIFLINCFIPEFKEANRYNHSPRRPRKLLLKKKEVKKLLGQVKITGITLVPLSIYFNAKNFAKIELAVCKGKKEYDKRETLKQEDWKRQKARVLKGNF
jgi:SsrA-binding protein